MTIRDSNRLTKFEEHDGSLEESVIFSTIDGNSDYYLMENSKRNSKYKPVISHRRPWHLLECHLDWRMY